ncbi:hypothetical protein NC651_009763 [Populus alba x Populus x berolinensis]|nr:hypothetical protein NC651_009763 [Populus alba x Populus x berolinensis]
MDSAKDCLSHTSLARRGPEEKSGSTCFSMISTNRPPFPSSQVDHEELAFIYKISWRDDFLSGATRRKTSAGILMGKRNLSKSNPSEEKQ